MWAKNCNSVHKNSNCMNGKPKKSTFAGHGENVLNNLRDVLGKVSGLNTV